MGFGRAVHELLEWSARNGWALPPGDVRAAALLREGADGADAGDRTLTMLEGWLSSTLLDELRDAGAELRPELPFRVALGADTVLRGTIDLLARAPDGGLTIVDYKTDRIGPGGGVPDFGEAYRLQRSLYAAAVADATGAESVRTAYVFLERPDEPILEVLDGAEIDAGRARIRALVEEIRSGRFEATHHPHRALCQDCPARERLCPHDLEATGRPEPEPAIPPATALAAA